MVLSTTSIFPVKIHSSKGGNWWRGIYLRTNSWPSSRDKDLAMGCILHLRHTMARIIPLEVFKVEP